MTKQNKQSAEAAVRDIRRRTRRKFSPEEKIRIVLEGLAITVNQGRCANRTRRSRMPEPRSARTSSMRSGSEPVGTGTVPDPSQMPALHWSSKVAGFSSLQTLPSGTRPPSRQVPEKLQMS